MVNEFACGGASPKSAQARWRMENNAGEENGVWRRAVDWLMPEFVPVGRLGPGAPDGGVVYRNRSCRQKSLLSTEVEGSGASSDEGGVAKGRHDH